MKATGFLLFCTSQVPLQVLLHRVQPASSGCAQQPWAPQPRRGYWPSSKSSPLKRVRESHGRIFIRYCCPKIWGQFQHPDRILFFFLIHNGMKLCSKYNLNMTCYSFLPVHCDTLHCGAVLSATEHGFVFNVFPVILRTTATPKSIFTPCPWYEHLLRVLSGIILPCKWFCESVCPARRSSTPLQSGFQPEQS